MNPRPGVVRAGSAGGRQEGGEHAQGGGLARSVGADETGAAPGDLLPELVAGQIAWLQNAVMDAVGRAMGERREPAAVSREVMARLDAMEELLSAAVLGYAAKNTP
ncbi:hypothetical protein RKE29_26455 [Streptomyces sp. B1866]|nr:hypothetical protein [Streptomyces sp. B1866]MDT3400122.1 hypothetical protein [Streptomyces sp. B1866]